MAKMSLGYAAEICKVSQLQQGLENHSYCTCLPAFVLGNWFILKTTTFKSLSDFSSAESISLPGIALSIGKTCISPFDFIFCMWKQGAK